MAFEIDVLDRIENNPRLSTRSIGHSTRFNHVDVWKVLKEQLLFPYHLQKVQTLHPGDAALRMIFCDFLRIRRHRTSDFHQCILFTDEATFHCDGYTNSRNSHVWADANPHAVIKRGAQRRFSVNLWAGMVGEFLLGPYILPPRVNGRIYLTFLEEQLPEYLDDLPLGLRSRLWFQHDGAPIHFVRDVRQFLDAKFPNR